MRTFSGKGATLNANAVFKKWANEHRFNRVMADKPAKRLHTRVMAEVFLKYLLVLGIIGFAAYFAAVAAAVPDVQTRVALIKDLATNIFAVLAGLAGGFAIGKQWSESSMEPEGEPVARGRGAEARLFQSHEEDEEPLPPS